jgi:hypothetical protein
MRRGIQDGPGALDTLAVALPHAWLETQAVLVLAVIVVGGRMPDGKSALKLDIVEW